jgi:signal transduction histidine kinase
MTWPIVTMPIETEADVVAVRQRARRIAELLGFERQDQTRIATAVSEIARNAFGYGGGGRTEFLVDANATPQAFLVRIIDAGPGIGDLDEILEGRYRSASGMGLGLVGAKRLMDLFRVDSRAGEGTTVELGQYMPRAAKLTRTQLSDVAKHLTREQSADPITALREQNQELLHSLEELRRRQDEANRLSHELGDTNRGVVALYAELEDKADQLRQASEQKSRFLSNMSHEFRTPLNSIMALSRLLLDNVDGELNAEQGRQVGYIRRSAEQLLDLVNDLLDLAKVEAGRVEIKPSTFTTTELFSTLRGALKPLHQQAGVELLFVEDANLPPLVTDEGKVAQILRNLVSNALKFTEKGEVRVTARRHTDDRIAFAVADTGVGIAPADHERIFDEFTQIDSRLQKYAKGTGLGLPLSRRLAELLGGAILLESEVGVGSTFTLVLPNRYAAEAAGATDETGRKRILVIDDDETFQYVLRQILSFEARYEVLEARDGEDGLRRAREDHPDVIVLDLQMPNVDGFAFLHELELDPSVSATPVIVSTSLAVNSELRARLPAGVPILSKHSMSRENVSMLLREAVQGRA